MGREEAAMSSIDTELNGGQRGPSITIVDRDGVTVLGLVGEHDAAVAPELAAVIRQQCALKHGVVVSFAETDFIDSSIVRELFAGDRGMLAGGRRLVLHTGREPVDRVLKLVRAEELLVCCDQLDDAIEFASQHDSRHGEPPNVQGTTSAVSASGDTDD